MTSSLSSSEVPSHSWRARELAAQLLWSSSRLAHHVGRMERRRLVRRTGSETDRWAAVVALTGEGWSTLRRADRRTWRRSAATSST